MRAAVATLFLFFSLFSASANEPTLIKGLGANTCAVFANDYQKNPRIEVTYFTWALGYMSALNTTQAENKLPFRNLTGKPISEMESAIRTFCIGHSLFEYTFAVRDLYQSLPVVPYP